MPNYDGTGPLKRGRVIGRGTGSCKKVATGCLQEEQDPDYSARNLNAAKPATR
ncbi:MAG: DUF5320 domain-containing protein [Methanoregula sp.]|jgi:hypothetical protein|uniref:DUF5320 domain-containing protein n=1 Tax=Methanoregula sp. TaxID=2052170 RepID=UPI0025D88627|nr:DUF5320 domain-containing protein [Methanoregula sp.]MCK9632236.1 DUF5320 domain-containing protein [Methanoregula sp.]